LEILPETLGPFDDNRGHGKLPHDATAVSPMDLFCRSNPNHWLVGFHQVIPKDSLVDEEESNLLITEVLFNRPPIIPDGG
jgi:hypothetical protein